MFPSRNNVKGSVVVESKTFNQLLEEDKKDLRRGSQ